MKAKRGRPRKLNKTCKNRVKQDVSTTNNIMTEKQKFNNIVYLKIQFNSEMTILYI